MPIAHLIKFWQYIAFFFIKHIEKNLIMMKMMLFLIFIQAYLMIPQNQTSEFNTYLSPTHKLKE